MPRRKTKAQSAVLELLQQESKALSHDSISAILGTEMDRVTIYRILNRFVKDGIVHRIVGDDGRQYFATSHAKDSHDHSQPHVHFRCVDCDQVECVPGEVGYQLPKGYRVDNCNIILSGVCQNCNDN
ncbi:MAG: transcriptional repressor [Bacteroidota bacterium]